VTVAGDLRVGSAGFLPAGTSEVDAETLARFLAHPLFAEDVAAGRIEVEGDEPAAVMAPEPKPEPATTPAARRTGKKK
jgi:hypothetical protein